MSVNLLSPGQKWRTVKGLLGLDVKKELETKERQLPFAKFTGQCREDRQRGSEGIQVKLNRTWTML